MLQTNSSSKARFMKFEERWELINKNKERDVYTQYDKGEMEMKHCTVKTNSISILKSKWGFEFCTPFDQSEKAVTRSRHPRGSNNKEQPNCKIFRPPHN